MSDKSDQHYDNGVLAYQEERFGDAVVEFKAAVQEDLNNWGAHLYLGMSHFKMSDLDNAARVFRFVHGKCPHSEIRLKAMTALQSVENQLSTGEPVGSISKVLQRPSEETLKRIHDEAEARKATREQPLQSLEMVKAAKAAKLAPTPAADPSAVTTPMVQPDFAKSPSKGLIPPQVGLAFIGIVVLGAIYWAGSFAIPGMYDQLFLKPSKQIGPGYGQTLPSNVQKEDITFIGPGGVEMYGMHLQTGSKYVVMINRGTTGNLGDDWPLVEQLLKTGVNVFIYDYRGFGKSGGKADSQGLVDDALLAHDHLIGRMHYKREDVIVLGKGVGSGVAAEIAHRRPTAGVILISGYPNLTAIARQRNPLLSIYVADLMPKESYDSSAWAKEHNSALLLTADDPMIPADFTKQFYDRVAEPKKVEAVKCSAGSCDYEPAVKFVDEATK
jgi:pimeloyl-ACP methyl ester carboxylesterase